MPCGSSSEVQLDRDHGHNHFSDRGPESRPNLGRPTEGFVLGLLLGPVGWVFAARLEPSRSVRVARRRALRRPSRRAAVAPLPFSDLSRSDENPWGISASEIAEIRTTYGETFAAVLDEVRNREGSAEAAVDGPMLAWLCTEVDAGRGESIDLRRMLEERTPTGRTVGGGDVADLSDAERSARPEA